MGSCPAFTHYQKPQLKPSQSLRMCSLTVYDESHSCTLQLPEQQTNNNILHGSSGRQGASQQSTTIFSKLIEGRSVLVLRNACTLLDSQNCLFLTMASPKYSSIQVYNSGQAQQQQPHQR